VTVATVIYRRVFSPRSVGAAALRRVLLPGVVACLCLAATGRTQQITLTLDDLTGAGFSAQGIRLAFVGGGATVIEIATVTYGAQAWKNIKLDCKLLQIERTRVACDDGELTLAEKIPLSFSYLTDKRVLDVTLKPAKDESWQVNLRPASASTRRGNDVTVRVANGSLLRFLPWLPTDIPKLNAGVVNGTVDYNADGRIHAKLALSNMGFADAAGLHAGEKIALAIEAQAEPAADHVRWNASLDWTAGEVFWQPVYLKAARQQVSAAGRLDARALRVERGALKFPGVGDTSFSGEYDLAAKQVTQGRVSAQTIPMAALYESVLKPFLNGTSFADLRTEGRVSAEVELSAKGLQRVDVRLENVSFEDKTQQRFALFDVNGAVPWRADAATQADITVKGGELLKMPVGAFAIPLAMNGTRFELKQLRVPLLDGQIDVRDFIARVGAQSGYWQFTGGVSGLSMDKFTTALGLPVMYGTLDATLPMVRHVKSTLRVDGALFLKVFDGSIEAKNLVLLDIFGKAPRVQADVAMRNLNLEMVTRTYSFGNITGRIDANVAGLELVNWQPVKFDARVASSAGEYPRKISQAAVQNISALGGAGAAAAIQRSFLRFFEQFGYDKLGWGCKLQNTVCEMSGVAGEDKPQGYVIVKGGGIPAITVMGYNRQVSWHMMAQTTNRRTLLGMLTGTAVVTLLSAGCVTINIYFPAAAAEKAADRIIDEVWQLKGGVPVTPSAPAPKPETK
jgi:hypothetical protein